MPARNFPALQKVVWAQDYTDGSTTSLASYMIFREKGRSGHTATIELSPQHKLAVTQEIDAIHTVVMFVNYMTCLADVSILSLS